MFSGTVGTFHLDQTSVEKTQLANLASSYVVFIVNSRIRALFKRVRIAPTISDLSKLKHAQPLG